MRSHKNKVIIAAAGSGKTTQIVSRARESNDRSLIVTYTLNNESEIRRKFYELNRVIPQNVTIVTWFRFLLSDWIRPYGNYVHPHRIANINFHGKPSWYTKKADIKFFVDVDQRVYRDRTSQFAIKCNTESGLRVMRRLTQLYNHIYVDEVQDLRGYDLDLLELLLESDINVTLVGDNRQSTYQTNRSMKNSRYVGYKILDKFFEWENEARCEVELLDRSFRCNQAICDFADRIFPEAPNTVAGNHNITGHDGLFVVRSKDVASYINCFRPQVLRYNRAQKCQGYDALNFGDSKGLDFPRVLIFLFEKLNQVLNTGDFTCLAPISAAKIYVAVTRARHSVAFVCDSECRIDGVSSWNS